MLPRSKFTYTHKNKILTLALRVMQFMFSPSTKMLQIIIMILFPKILMCQKSMGYEKNNYAKVHDKESMPKSMMHIEKRREKTMGT
jgi:hypothetical protein